MPYAPLRPDTIDAVVTGQHGDPFAVLGPHAGREGMVSVRALIPAARAVAAVMPDGTVSPLRAVHPAGFWEGEVPGRRLPLAYRLRVVDEQGQVSEVEDPYRFPPTLSPYDLHLLGEGTHYRLFERLGAHPIRHEGVEGVRFVVWAPNARRVSVVGDWNGWDGRRQPMRLHPGNGLWELFVPGVALGARYKYEIIGRGRRAARAQDRPGGVRLRARRAAHRLRGHRPQRLHVGRRGVDGRAQAPERPAPADVGVRDAPGLVAAPRGGRPAELPRDGRAARRLRERDGLHPRGAPPGDRASLLRLLGLPDPRLLRAHPPLRHAHRLHGLRGHPPPAGHRGHHGLGAGALPQGRARARLLRRHPPLRARRSATCATIPTGAPACSTSGGARSPTSSSPMRCSGSSATTSTACGSTRSPP